MDPEIALALTRLKMRSYVVETVLMRVYTVLLKSTGGLDPQAARARAELSLEELGTSVQQTILASPLWGSFSDEERAMYADELHEIVAEMKDLLP